jgi:cyclopropane fatty-acyl-phospholipid synthase-like methyltransferase
MGLFNVIGKQLQHPKGVLGKALFGWMTTKTIAHSHWTADLMDVQPDDHLLEVGFGNGANVELLAERASNGRVAGAEISKTAVEMAS